VNDRKSLESSSERDLIDKKDSSYGDSDDDGATPLLGKDGNARTYDTTQIGGSHEDSTHGGSQHGGSQHDSHKSKSDLTSDDEDDDDSDAEREDIMRELEDIQKLVKETQNKEEEARKLVNKIPRWFMFTLVGFFSMCGLTALVTGLLFAFNTIPGSEDLLQWIVVGVALGGNCLGSFALFYSGSFKTELKELVKGIKKLQFASDKLKSNVKVLTKHRGALTKTHQVLKGEIKKLKDEIEKFEENKDIMNNTAGRIGDNTKALQVENDNIRREKDNLNEEKERYDESMIDMDDNRKLVETYNTGAESRVKDLSNIVETLQKTIPQLNKQLAQFDEIREDVEKTSTVMGAEVDQTAKTVKEIFDEIRELTIRQERVMLYQLMERIIGTTETRDMGHEQFKRFLLQVPKDYEGHAYDDRWFGQAAVEGRIGHTELKDMIDTITLQKVGRQLAATEKQA